MLESLMEIEVAYSMLQAGDAEKDKDPIDAHFDKLNTKIEVIYIFIEFKVIKCDAMTYNIINDNV